MLDLVVVLAEDIKLFIILFLLTNIIMFSLSSTLSATTYTTPYPSNRLNKATNFKTMFDTVNLPYNKMYNGCSSNLCYTISKGLFIYKPHTDVGMVGRSAAGYLFQRKRM
jgi:hypothetical protein